MSKEVFDSKRREIFQEHINKRVLVEWVRITGLDNKAKWKLDRLLSYLSNTITGYTGTENAFTWPTFAGVSGGIPARKFLTRIGDTSCLRVAEGLLKHNKEQGTKIAVIKEQILRNQDSNNFGYVELAFVVQMLVMHMLILACWSGKNYTHCMLQRKVKAPEISVKRGLLHIGKNMIVKPSIVAISLNLVLSEWKGLPPEELLSESERKDFLDSFVFCAEEFEEGRNIEERVEEEEPFTRSVALDVGDLSKAN
ncbi:hypothetical protein COOONC_15921 [Cooperia oncophora]